MMKRDPALNVIVSAAGNIDLRLPIFACGRVPVLIITTRAGARLLAKRKLPDSIGIRAVRAAGPKIAPGDILEEVTRAARGRRVLIEGGPHLLGSFYAERLIDEQFLTLAPQIAGRDAGDRRLSLVMGEKFAPSDPLWGALTDVRRGGSYLFLRYSFGRNRP